MSSMDARVLSLLVLLPAPEAALEAAPLTPERGKGRDDTVGEEPGDEPGDDGGEAAWAGAGDSSASREARSSAIASWDMPSRPLPCM
jgi:hypothetical protein